MLNSSLSRQVLAVIGFLAVGSAQAADRYILDPTHTYPNFTISHLGFSTMHGRFNTTEGFIEVDGGKAVSLEVRIDSNSIDTGMQKRDDHLRNEDFLHVEKYPHILYRSQNIVRHDNHSATVEGELTLLGVTKPVTLTVDAINCGTHPMNQKYTCGFNATTTIKRSDFGMNAYLPAVGDEVNIRIEAEAARASDTAGPRK